MVDGAATNWWVIGHDAPGAMYGGLELAEAVKLADGLAGVTNRQTNPYLANRGIKFNIPLDARTPTLFGENSSRRMTAQQSNVAEMWSMDFWTGISMRWPGIATTCSRLWSLKPVSVAGPGARVSQRRRSPTFRAGSYNPRIRPGPPSRSRR